MIYERIERRRRSVNREDKSQTSFIGYPSRYYNVFKVGKTLPKKYRHLLTKGVRWERLVNQNRKMRHDDVTVLYEMKLLEDVGNDEEKLKEWFKPLVGKKYISDWTSLEKPSHADVVVEYLNKFYGEEEEPEEPEEVKKLNSQADEGWSIECFTILKDHPRFENDEFMVSLTSQLVPVNNPINAQYTFSIVGDIKKAVLQKTFSTSKEARDYIRELGVAGYYRVMEVWYNSETQNHEIKHHKANDGNQLY